MCKTEVRQLRNYHEYIKTLDSYHYHIKTKDNTAETIGGRVLVCGKCGRIIARLGDAAVGYWTRFVCQCGESCRMSENADEIKEVARQHKAKEPYKTKDGVFCPKCSSRLFVLKKNVLPKISLYLKCSCGEIYRCKYIKIENKKRI